MKATVDANILFSALLKKGLTRKIWFNPTIKLYAPEYLLTEFLKHKGFLQKKFSGSEKELAALCQKLILQISFVNNKELKPFMPAAAFLSNDQKDLLYLACALKEDTIIWSNDKEFKKQSRIKVKTTTELMQELGFL
ncbi:hypothetical protein HZB88_04975 [archaeon]|nr:hypothetical protein [archaeon]